MSARRLGVVASRALQQQAHRSAPVALQLPLESASSSGSSDLLLAAAGVATAVSIASLFLAEETRCDAKFPTVALPSAAELAPTSLVGDSADSSALSKPRGRRNLLKNRTRHKAKLEEVDLMKIHLDEYKKARAAFDSPAKRFELYASASIASDADKTNDSVGVGVGGGVAAMTFTDFVHSQILPRFHTRLPHPDVVYECEFVGNANGLITYEEFYLLNHLLKIPKEHFDVAFCMFDLDGDGAVDKDEFCHVIENLLKAISAKEEEPRLLHVSAESTLPRLTKYLFGRYGKKKIRATDLEAALDVLHKQIIKAEFDLYATQHPHRKKEDVISVHDFAITMLNCFDADRLPPYLERVEQLNSSDAVVGWEDFFNFYFYVQSNLADIKLAFELTGADEITEADFVRAAQVVTGVVLPFPVVQLAFRVFDDNESGTLDQAELLKVLEMRTTVETQRNRGDSKFQRFTQCMKGPAE